MIEAAKKLSLNKKRVLRKEYEIGCSYSHSLIYFKLTLLSSSSKSRIKKSRTWKQGNLGHTMSVTSVISLKSQDEKVRVDKEELSDIEDLSYTR